MRCIRSPLAARHDATESLVRLRLELAPHQHQARRRQDRVQRIAEVVPEHAEKDFLERDAGIGTRARFAFALHRRPSEMAAGTLPTCASESTISPYTRKLKRKAPACERAAATWRCRRAR
jgi:hypothetical protein